MFGPWKQIAPGYGKMVLGYFGKTPTAPDSEIVKIASKKLNLEPTDKNPLDIADKDEKKSIAYWRQVLKDENLEVSDENIFIAAAGDQKGIRFLKGEAEVMIRKNSDKNNKGEAKMAGDYTVVVDGQKFSVQVAEGNADIKVTQSQDNSSLNNSTESANDVSIGASVSGNVWKILKDPGDRVEEGEKIMILEAMKMEIDIVAPKDGKIVSILVKTNEAVKENQILAVIN
jgi:pyruvate carboxylase subunit B